MNRLLPSPIAAALCACASAVALAQTHGIEYSTPREALAALRARPDTQIRVERGWTVVEDRKNQAFWSFTPEGHPAHPAAIKRWIFEKDGALYIDGTLLCSASRPVCEQLVGEFKMLDQSIREEMQRKAQQGAPADAPRPASSGRR